MAKLTAERNIPKSKASTQADLPPNAISDYISKQYIPRADTALRLARVFNVSLDWLIDDLQSWPPPETNEGTSALLANISDWNLVIELAERYRKTLVDLKDVLAALLRENWVVPASKILSVPIESVLPPDLQRLEQMIKTARSHDNTRRLFSIEHFIAFAPALAGIDASELVDAKLIEKWLALEAVPAFTEFEDATLVRETFKDQSLRPMAEKYWDDLKQKVATIVAELDKAKK